MSANFYVLGQYLCTETFLRYRQKRVQHWRRFAFEPDGYRSRNLLKMYIVHNIIIKYAFAVVNDYVKVFKCVYVLRYWRDMAITRYVS